MDVRFTERPDYSGYQQCSAPALRAVQYRLPANSGDPGYDALFGVFCGVDAASQTMAQYSFSSTDGKYPGKQAHVIDVTAVVRNGSVEKGSAVAFFDTRQNRWSIILGRGETIFFWPEGRRALGAGRGNYNGSRIRLHKGNKQSWGLLSRVR